MFSSQSSGDDFPLPQIDVLVDNTNTAGHGMLSFMDAFSWYNQIQMAEEDREKAAFITHVLLQGDAVWSKECRGDVPASHDSAVSWYDSQGK